MFLSDIFSTLYSIISPDTVDSVTPSVIPHNLGPVKLHTLCSFFTKKSVFFATSDVSGDFLETERNFPLNVKKLKIQKKQAIGKEKNQYACAIYNIVLTKIVNIIGKKQFILRNTTLSLEDRTQAEAFVAIFNSYYIKYLNKYREIPQEMTLKSLFFSEIYSNFPLLKKHRFLSPEEIEYKKQFADMGYSIMHELEKWLKTPLQEKNMNFSHIMCLQFTQFLQWADKHPRTASLLAADIALTCFTLLGQEELDCFVSAMNAKTCTHLFLDALGICPEYEEVETEEMLKYRALADFVSYFPIFAASYNILKETSAGNYNNLDCSTFFTWALTAIAKTVKTAGLQIAIRMIPKEQENLVRIALDVLRGKDMQKIVMHQRNLKLLQMAGAVRQVLANPTDVLASYQIWWQSIFHAEGTEKKERILTQLFLPAIATASFAGLFFCGAVGIFNFWVACITGIGLSSAIFFLSSFLTNQIDKKYCFKTRRAVIAEHSRKVQEEELLQASHLLMTDPEKKEGIRKEVHKYVRDLQSHYALVVVPENISEKRSLLDTKELELIEETKKKYEEKLNKGFHSEKNPLKAQDIIQLFNEIVDLKKLRENLHEYPKDKVDTMIFSLADDLIKGWLQIHLEKIFRQKCLNALHKESKPNLNKPYISPKEYIASHSDLKDYPEFHKHLLRD